MANPLKDAEFLSDCREEYQQDLDRDRIDRTEAIDDHIFVYASDATVRNENGLGSQWSELPWKARKAANRPILQWNRMHTYQQHVVNQGRQNDFMIQVSRADGGEASTVDYFRDRIRQIEYESNAGTAYDIMREGQVSSGRGFCQISTRFKPNSFEQIACIEAIPDQFSVLFGPGEEYDRSDSDRCWKIKNITKSAYKRLYGKVKLQETVEFAATEPSMSNWVNVGRNGDMVQIAEKYQKEYAKYKLYMLADGVTAVRADEFDDDKLQELIDADYFYVDEDGEPVEREEEEITVWRYTIDGAHVLDKEEFIIDEIPIIPQWGLCAVIGGIQRQYSLGNRAKDAQRLVNLYVSNIAQLIGQQVKAKYLVAVGQIDEVHKNDWAGLTNASLYYYSRFDENGRDLGVPIEAGGEPNIQALTLGLQQALEGMKAAHGIYDASMGERSNETSGIAIESRKQQAEVVNYHFVGNEARSRKRLAQVLVKVICRLDTPGSMRAVRSQDGKTRYMQVTEDLSDVDLGITVDMGPSYKSAMQQVHQTDAEMIKAMPELMTVLGEEFMRTQDAPNAEQRAEIMRRWINQVHPGLLPPDPEEEGKQPQIPPEMLQELQAQKDKADKALAFAQELHEKLQTEEIKRQAEAEKQDKELAFKREELSLRKWETEVKSRTELAKVGMKGDHLLLEEELAQANASADRAHEAQESEAERIAEGEAREQERQAQVEDREAVREATVEDRDIAREDAQNQAEMAVEGE